MERGFGLNTLILLGCAILVSSGGAGKKVLLKIHVPELIKHQHHTNVVFVHKHHDDHDKLHHKHHDYHYHGDHDKPNHKHHDDGVKPDADYHAHVYGGHYSDNYGEPPGYHHSHSFDHQHQYSFSHGHDDDHHGHKLGEGDRGHKKTTHGHTQAKKSGKKKQGSVAKKSNHKQPSSKNQQDKEKENYFDFAINYEDPNTKTKHYHYETFTPTFSFDNNNNVRVSNQSIRHESLKIETTGNSSPEADSFENFPNTQSKGNYEVEEPSFYYNTKNHNANYDKKTSAGGFQGNSGYDGNNEDERNNGVGSYAEDYTNPNSVAKYTADIQHGAIDLEKTSYNPEHGNDLEVYIRASGNSDDI